MEAMVDVENIQANLAVNVKRMRERKNLSQRQLAKAAGVTNAHISRIESGLVKNLYVPQFVLIANALGVSTDRLLSEPS